MWLILSLEGKYDETEIERRGIGLDRAPQKRCRAKRVVRAMEGGREAGMSSVNTDLKKAYRATHYHVYADPRFTLHIDAFSAPLLACLKAHGAAEGAFITGWNPFSQDTERADNEAAHQSLKAALIELGAVVIPGFGAWPDDPASGEESFLTIGLDYETACRLGRAYRQNAIVTFGADAVPRLVMLI